MLHPIDQKRIADYIRVIARETRNALNCGALEAASVAAGKILIHFLGIEWAELHFMNKSAPTNFFRSDYSDDDQYNTHHIRIIHLAEMLINLQRIAGFRSVLEKLKRDNPESAFAELETGKILSWSNARFNFNPPSGRLSCDYDLNIFTNDREICADTKCKLESTAIGVATLLQSLRTASKQLPFDRPGIIFLKAPQNWGVDGEFLDTCVDATNKFFRGTGRIVGVYVYSSMIFDFSTHSSPMILIGQFKNSNHRFDKNVQWDILKDNVSAPDGWIDIARIADEDRGTVIFREEGNVYISR